MKLNPCACGAKPRFRSSQVAEDSVDSWIECSCGRRTEAVEDAYADYGTAAWLWNSGCTALASKGGGA